MSSSFVLMFSRDERLAPYAVVYITRVRIINTLPCKTY